MFENIGKQNRVECGISKRQRLGEVMLYVDMADFVGAAGPVDTGYLIDERAIFAIERDRTAAEVEQPPSGMFMEGAVNERADELDGSTRPQRRAVGRSEAVL
jgi:hypothetical protein